MSGKVMLARRNVGGRIVSEKVYREDTVPEVGEVEITGYYLDRKISVASVKALSDAREPEMSEPAIRIAPKTRINHAKERNLALLRKVGARWHRAGWFSDPRIADATRSGR